MGEWSRKATFFGLAAIVTVGVGGLAGVLARTASAPPRFSPTTATGAVSQPAMAVHVTGWVVAPGVVSVEEGSIVADVISAAGGIKPGARTDQINLAATVFDGDQVVVPGPGTVPEAGDNLGQGLISLNRATPADLEELPGVGPVLATRIVDFREEHGRFESVDDLLEVPGIGEAKLASIRDLVRP